MSTEIPLARPDIGAAEIDAVTEVLLSGRLSLGPRLEAFEAAVTGHCGCRGAVAVSSGTAGLELALEALDIGSGDEVITSPFSFVASANVIARTGATPVFVDIDPGSLALDPDRLERAITARTRAILVVHVFGHPAPMEPIVAVAQRHGLKLVEDACEAIGARLAGRAVGTFGHLGVFGFYPNKVITSAEGGMIVSDDLALLSTLRRLRNQGRDPGSETLDDERLGRNCRLSELHCALGLVQMRRLDEILARRREIAGSYTARLRRIDQLV